MSEKKFECSVNVRILERVRRPMIGCIVRYRGAISLPYRACKFSVVKIRAHTWEGEHSICAK